MLTQFTQGFDATDTEILPPCYPIESVTKFELKSNEADGWSEQTGVQYLIRRQCAISLSSPLHTPNSALCTARIQYAGGYVLPGSTPSAGQTALPDDLEQAAVEQVAYWFRNRDTTASSALGLMAVHTRLSRNWIFFWKSAPSSKSTRGSSFDPS